MKRATTRSRWALAWAPPMLPGLDRRQWATTGPICKEKPECMPSLRTTERADLLIRSSITTFHSSSGLLPVVAHPAAEPGPIIEPAAVQGIEILADDREQSREMGIAASRVGVGFALRGLGLYQRPDLKAGFLSAVNLKPTASPRLPKARRKTDRSCWARRRVMVINLGSP